jgi:cation transporter-like permease
MIDLLIALIVFAIVGGLLYWLVTLLPLPDPFAKIIQVAVVLICILVVLGIAFGGISMPLTLRR